MLYINNNFFLTKVAKTDKEIQEGMSFKMFDDDFNSMIFLLKPDNHCFWMKNCIIPLDIIFIKNKKISKIFHNCKPCPSQNCEKFCHTGDMVLEVLGGTCEKLGIKENMDINFLK